MCVFLSFSLAFRICCFLVPVSTADKTTNLIFAGIKACMESMHPVDEEPYEVCLDNHGCCDGPKTGRLSVLDNVSLLLRNALAQQQDHLFIDLSLLYFLMSFCFDFFLCRRQNSSMA